MCPNPQHAPSHAAFALGTLSRHQGRHGNEVIRLEGVPHAEQRAQPGTRGESELWVHQMSAGTFPNHPDTPIAERRHACVL